MNGVSLAERRYEQVMPTPNLEWDEFPVRTLLVWLKDDVCPVLEDYSRRPAFREQASWPLRGLVAGAATPERRCIEAVDGALVHCAKVLLSMAGPKPPASETASPIWSLTRKAEISAAGVRSLRLAASRDTSQVEWSQVEGIAHHFWTDLVCADDFFEPCGGWPEQRDSNQGQPGDFVLSLNPELHPVGDFVTRCLLRRVEVLHAVLTQFRRRLQDGGGMQVTQAWGTLEECIQALRATCQAGRDAQLRESCVILMQTYAAFHPAPDCRWLGLSESTVRGIPMLKHRLTNRRIIEMPERIAAALGNLRRLYEGGTPQTAAVEEAIAGEGLVVIKNPPKVFWKGEVIEAKWNKTPSCWKLLLALATGNSVAASDLYDELVSESTLPVTINRLRPKLPPSLRKLIVPSVIPGSYHLDLERRRVSVFDRA